MHVRHITRGSKMANRKGVEKNRLLLAYYMMKGGMNIFDAWKQAGAKIKRSEAARRGAVNRKVGVLSA